MNSTKQTHTDSKQMSWGLSMCSPALALKFMPPCSLGGVGAGAGGAQ